MAFIGSGILTTRRVVARRVSSRSRFVLMSANQRAVNTSVTTQGESPTGSEKLAPLREALMKFYDEVPCQPIMVRLAWHDAGTYNKDEDIPGPDASIRFKTELDHGANNGLGWAIEQMELFKQKFPEMSYADLYQFASVVAIEHVGGPQIPFKTGRVDATEAECTPDGRLPDATKRMGHLRDVFYRMGLTDKDIVLLSGAHTIGKAHKDRSGFEGPWTKNMYTFDNAYFKEIMKKELDTSLLQLESDLALMDEPHTRELVELYANDQEKFFEDYAVSHQKLSELGWNL